ITASAIGNATEWFDYGIYAYGVSYIAESIFPGDAASTTLLAFMTFAVSFLVRPIGGLVWGAARRSHRTPTDIGDHHPALFCDRVVGARADGGPENDPGLLHRW
ncbi:MAG: transporter, family, proline/betaine transporter, partial [Mycobacterium sp.]|nr:transporter, family, proline/betaine transporter [Mycobacterium sp.]